MMLYLNYAKILQEKKLDMVVTLDPDVTGVLPIAVGKATRVIEYMTEAGKVYEEKLPLAFRQLPRMLVEKSSKLPQ